MTTYQYPSFERRREGYAPCYVLREESGAIVADVYTVEAAHLLSAVNELKAACELALKEGTSTPARVAIRAALHKASGKEHEEAFRARIEKAASFDRLDRETELALEAFRDEHGRKWKEELSKAWMKGSLPGVLHRLRNTHGPEWLAQAQ